MFYVIYDYTYISSKNTACLLAHILKSVIGRRNVDYNVEYKCSHVNLPIKQYAVLINPCQTMLLNALSSVSAHFPERKFSE